MGERLELSYVATMPEVASLRTNYQSQLHRSLIGFTVYLPVLHVHSRKIKSFCSLSAPSTSS